MSLGYSNVLAILSVLVSLITGFWLVVPRLSGSTRRYFVILLVGGGVLYVVGQVSQLDKLGPIWLQHHTLDFAFMFWTTAILAIAHCIATLIRRRTVDELFVAKSLRLGFIGTVVIAIVTEVWDTMQQSFFDSGDYLTFLAGGLVAVIPIVTVPSLREVLLGK